MGRIWSASYKRGHRLAEAGCAVPYIEALPGRERFYRRALYAYQVSGYFESCAIDHGTSTGYVIALGVGTDLPCGAIINSCDLIVPWPDHAIDWSFDPESVLPKSKLYDYGKLVESRLPGVLNDRKILSRGRPVEGLLCGCAWQPIAASYPREQPVRAEIVLISDSGACVRLPIRLGIYTAVRDKSRRHNSAASWDLRLVQAGQ